MYKRDGKKEKKLRFGREELNEMQNSQGASILMFPRWPCRTFWSLSLELGTSGQSLTVSVFKVTIRESFSYCEASRPKKLSEKVPFRVISAAD